MTSSSSNPQRTTYPQIEERFAANAATKTDVSLSTPSRADGGASREDLLKAAFEDSKRYAILGVVGRGGMGTVLKAFDKTLDRNVAIKLLHRGVAERHAKRLVREARALAKLSHPNVVQVYEVGVVGEQLFIAMEFVKGQTLKQWKRQGDRWWQRCVQVYLQAGQGLAAAHAQGLVHRDFKPSNCIIDDDGRVKVLDFGLVQQASALEWVTDDSIEGASTLGGETRGLQVEDLTRTGMLMGTPAYMSPEQARAEPVDARSDQFSFCVALYEALYGRRPFVGTTMEDLILALEVGEVQAEPRGSKVPGKVRRAVLRGLAHAPQQRWPTMEALLNALSAAVQPWRIQWITLLGGGLLGLAGMSMMLPVENGPVQPCQDGWKALQGVWDPTRKQKVKQALLDTNVSYAEPTWERVQGHLDSYAQRWAAQYLEVCEEIRLGNEGSAQGQKLRMECLGQGKQALWAAVGVLQNADAKVVQKAVAVVTTLPGLQRCGDVDNLRVRVPVPDDPKMTRQVEGQRQRLAEIKALLQAGKVAPAQQMVQDVMKQAQELGYRPLLAEARLQRGLVRIESGEYGDAEEDLKRVYMLGLEDGHEKVAMKAANVLTFLVGARQARHEQGQQLGETGLALAKRYGDDLDVADSLYNLGGVFFSQGKLDKAQQYYERALRILEGALSPGHPKIATSLSSLGSVFDRQGKWEKAQQYYERALRIREEALGDEHPRAAASLNNLGTVSHRQGKWEKAQQYYERALRIWEGALGPEHPNVAINLSNLGMVFRSQGKWGKAQEYNERALRIREEALGPGHPDVAASLNNLGTVFQSQEKWEKAQEYYERALRIREEALGPEHLNVAYILNNLGALLYRQSKWEESQEYLERALQIRENTLGPGHADVASPLHNLGLLFEHQRKWKRAQEYHERALRIYEEALSRGHPHVAYVLLGLATTALAQRQYPQARAHAERALSIRQSTNSVPPKELAEARFMLAKSLWPQQSERKRARELAEQAQQAYAKLGADQRESLAEVKTWLATHRIR